MTINEQDLKQVLEASLQYTNEQLKTSMDYTDKAVGISFCDIYNRIIDLTIEIKFLNAVLVQLGYTTAEIRTRYIEEAKRINTDLYLKEEDIHD